MNHDDTTMVRTQISFDAGLYRDAQRAAKKKGISLAELCRRLPPGPAHHPICRPTYAHVLADHWEGNALITSVILTMGSLGCA